MAITLLESESNQEAASGRFFYESLSPGRSIFLHSLEFFNDNQDILPYGYGAVAQWQENNDTQTFNTILFESQSYSSKTWQWTTASEYGGRRLQSFTVTQGGKLTGWQANYGARGELQGSTELTQDEIINLWQTLSVELESEKIQSEAEKVRKLKEKSREALAWFAVNREVRYSVFEEDSSCPERAIDSYVNKDVKKVLIFTTRLSQQAFEKEFEVRRKALAGFGFPVLRPLIIEPKPTAHNQQLRLFWPTKKVM